MTETNITAAEIAQALATDALAICEAAIMEMEREEFANMLATAVDAETDPVLNRVQPHVCAMGGWN